MAMHIYEPPPPLRSFEPSIPEDLAALVHRLLEKNPAQRPPMVQVTQALEQLKAIHSTGALTADKLARVSGYMPALSSTPVPLGSSGYTGAGLGQTGHGHTGHGHTGVGHTGVGHTGVGHTGVGQTGHGVLGSTGLQPTPPAAGVSVSQTLGHSAAQISMPPRRRGPLVAVATLGVLVVAGAGLFGIKTLQDKGKEDHGGVTPPGQTQPARKVRFVLNSEPAGATVLRASDKKELGQTPWQTEQPAGSGQLVLILRRPGFADRVVTVDQSANAVIKETLEPMTAPSAPTAAAPEPRGKFWKRGKRGAAPAGGAVAGSQATQGTSSSPSTSPAQPPPEKKSPPPKDDTSHARIQMVD
jgi:hypothetical protein